MSKKKLLPKEELKLKSREKKENLKTHYNNVFYSELKQYNTVLSDNEFYNFCKFYITKIIDDFDGKEYYLSERIGNLIVKEKKMFKNEENILLRYVILIGINDKVLNYFKNKYVFIIDKYKDNIYYEYVKNNFPIFVKLALENYDDMKKNIRVSIEREITKKLEEKKQKMRNKIKNIRSLSDQEQEEVRKHCFFIKKYVFNLYKDYINEDILKPTIDKKFDEYFNAYVNGISSASLTKYIDDRLVVYLEHLKNNQIRKRKHQKQINKNLMEKEYIIYWYEYKCKAFIPCYEILKQAYEKACNKYYELPRDFSVDEYLCYTLRQIVVELNKKYDINYIKNITQEFKKKLNVNYFGNEEQMNIALDNFEKYYMDNKLYKPENCGIKNITYKLEDKVIKSEDYHIENKLYKLEKYEEFLARMILSFNKKDYKNIKGIKNNNIKVLRK